MISQHYRVGTLLLVTLLVPSLVTAKSLHSVAKSGSIEEVKRLLSKGANINAEDEGSLTPIHALIYDRYIVASSKGTKEPLEQRTRYRSYVEMVKLLIANGVKINTKDGGGRSPLHYASMLGHQGVVELLITAGADVNMIDDAGNTPLHLSTQMGHQIVSESLITKGANVNAKLLRGDSPLHLAAARGRTAAVELLLARGADVNARNSSGKTPLYFITERRQTVIGHWDVMNLLIAYKANISARDNTYEFTPLHQAAEKGRLPIARLLIARGADVNAKDRWGSTPLHRAAYGHNRAMAELLINKGADVNATDYSGATPLFVARSTAMAKFLIANDANVNVTDHSGATLLFGVRSAAVAELLIDSGADVNVQDKGGITVLSMVNTMLKFSGPDSQKPLVDLALLLRRYGAEE